VRLWPFAVLRFISAVMSRHDRDGVFSKIQIYFMDKLAVCLVRAPMQTACLLRVVPKSEE
jgi:hypothetical protein